MSIDGDISAALPEPPPPRPARRDAAIAEALRRFDGGGSAPPLADRSRAPTSTPWRGRIVRPQFAAFATVALVALIGLPVWMSGDHQFSSVSREAPAGAPHAPAASEAAAGLPSASPTLAAGSAPANALKRQPPSSAAIADSDGAGCAGGKCAAPVDALRAKASDKPNVASFSTPQAQPAEEKRLDKDFSVQGRVELADAAPPPPAAAPAPPPASFAAPRSPVAGRMAEANISSDARAGGLSGADLVVTGQRRSAAKSASRGDWNACTVDDPSRRLGACTALVDPAAPGPAGRAAAHVADGLSRAWHNDFDGAIAAFDQAIAVSPRLSFAYLNRGLVYAHKGETKRALADLDQAVRYGPNAARNYYGRSLLWRQRGEAKRAEADQARAIALDR